jgi:hypothetical protein
MQSLIGPAVNRVDARLKVTGTARYAAEHSMRATAVLSHPTTDAAPSPRDRHIQIMQEKGRRGWQKAVGYGKRSLVETAMFRYKTLIGPTLHARKFAPQKAEAHVACSVINRMTQLGMPVSRRV